jgi:hypothetical protein
MEVTLGLTYIIEDMEPEEKSSSSQEPIHKNFNPKSI